MERYEVGETLSFSDTRRVIVRRAIKRDSRLAVVLKTQHHEDTNSVNSVFSEMMNQNSIGQSAVCTIYDCILSEEGQQLTTTLVLESMDKDLQREIEERRPSNRFAEFILWQYLRELVDALAIAQQRGISHRDIKPENLLLTTDHRIKISDFGSSKQFLRQGEMLQSIQGTMNYGSPLLRGAFISNIMNSREDPVQHNVFKSDVFSLGITMLVAARLEYPRDFVPFQGLQEKIERAISEIPYSPEFKSVLRRMMAYEESARPDFIALKAMLLEEFRAYPPQCSKCPKPLEWKDGKWDCAGS